MQVTADGRTGSDGHTGLGRDARQNTKVQDDEDDEGQYLFLDVVDAVAITEDVSVLPRSGIDNPRQGFTLNASFSKRLRNARVWRHELDNNGTATPVCFPFGNFLT